MRISVTGKLYAAVGGLFCALIALIAWLKWQIVPTLAALLGEGAHHFLSTTLFFVGGQPVRIWFVIKTILYLIFLTLLSRAGGYLIRKITQGNAGFGEHRRYVLSHIVSFFIYAAGILIGVHVERIQLSTLLVLGGTLGVGIGFGLQSLVSNLIAGLILFVEQPMRIGDLIEFGNRSGEVVRIGSRCSWIRTADNALLIIPNSEFTTKEILNWTASDPKIRLTIPVAVAHGSDILKVMRILLELARQHVDVLEHPVPEVLLTELGQNAMTFTMRVWTIQGVIDFAKLRSDLYLQIIQKFEEELIVMPFPQLDIHWTPAKPSLHASS